MILVYSFIPFIGRDEQIILLKSTYPIRRCFEIESVKKHCQFFALFKSALTDK